MNRNSRSGRELLVFFVSLLMLVAAGVSAAENSSWDLAYYISLVVDNSSTLADRIEDVEVARDDLESLQVSGGSEYEIEAAEITLEYKEGLVDSTRASLVADAAGTFIGVLQAERSLEQAQRQLELKEEAELASKERWDEGVHNEADYLSDMMARLNAELALLNTQNAFTRARRGLLRLAGFDPDASVAFVKPEIRLPDIEVDYDSLVAQGKRASASYRQAERLAELNERKYQAYRALGASVSAKLLESTRRAMENAKDSLSAQQTSIEDQAWELVSRYEYLRRSSVVAKTQADVAEKTWELQQQRYEFGIIMESDLAQHEFSYMKDLSAVRQKQEELFLHILDVQAFTGTQPEDVVPDLGL